jgi:gliding motility-associated-like protein
LWSEGSTSEDLTSVIAGVYNVSITDANGCVLEESVTINEPSAITSVLDGTNVSCYGFTDGAVDLTVSGGTSPYVCLWSTGATTEDITALSNGIYTVNITDANGCIVTENITITQPPELTVSISGTDIICNGFATGVIDFNVSGGTPDYDYAWSTGDTTEDLLEVVAGTYTVEVTDLNGCLESSSITLTEPSPLILDVLVEDVSCTGLSDGNVDVTMSGGTPTYTYDWSTGSTSEDLNDVSAGIYSVSVEDDNGCIISANISVEEPIDFDAGRDSLKAFCNEEGTILDLNTFLTATTEGLWTENTSSGQFNTSTGIFNIGGLAEGEYVFTYTIPAFTPCTDTVAIFTITVNPIPEISFIGDNLSGCAPLKVNFDEFSSPAGMDCAWDFGDGSGMVECGSVMHTYEYPGTYDVSLEVVTDKGCSNYLSIENYINVIQGPEAAFTYNPDVPTIDDPMVFFENMSLFASSYTWNFGDGTAEEFVPDPEHLFPDAPNADYTITLIAENDIGCTDTAQQIIQIQDVVIFFVPNVFTPDGDDYNQEFKPVMTAGYDIYDYHLSIFNRWGELVFESYNAEYGWDGTYGSKGLVQDGVYVWVIEFGETMSDKRHKFTGHVSILK